MERRTPKPSADGITARKGSFADRQRGWYVVAGAFLAHVVGVGSIYSFGVMFPLITEEFGRGQGATAWIIGVTNAVMLVAARPAGRYIDRFGPAVVVRFGAVTVAAGFIISSVAPSLLIVIVAFGALVGSGMTVAFVPGVAVVSQWFDERRGLALAIAVSGSGVGAFLMAPLVDFLVRTGSWRSAMQWVAAIVFGILMIVSVMLVPGPGREIARTKVRLGALLATKKFRQLFIGHGLVGFSFMVPFLYLVPYSLDVGIGATTAAWLLGIMGLSGVVGRVVLGVIGDRFGPMVAMTITCVGMTAGHILWAGSSALIGLLVTAVVYGWFAGAYAALLPAVTSRYLGLADFASVMGGVYFGAAAGMLLAAPLVGAIFDATGSYLFGILISLGFVIGGTAVYGRLWVTTRAVGDRRATSSHKVGPGPETEGPPDP